MLLPVQCYGIKPGVRPYLLAAIFFANGHRGRFVYGMVAILKAGIECGVKIDK